MQKSSNKYLLIGGAVILAIIVFSSFSNDASNTLNTANVGSVALATPTPTFLPTTHSNNDLSNDNYYTNSYGNQVHSPAYANTVPAGASARCGDGTYSFSQSRRGTCSHHGGVSQWLY